MAFAQTLPGEVFEGRRFAEEICIACHVDGKGENDASLEGASVFQQMADGPAATFLSLRIFPRMPHDVMPYYILTEEETDNLIAYIPSTK